MIRYQRVTMCRYHLQSEDQRLESHQHLSRYHRRLVKLTHAYGVVRVHQSSMYSWNMHLACMCKHAHSLLLDVCSVTGENEHPLSLNI